MNNLMILWRSWFLPWRTEMPEMDRHLDQQRDHTLPAARAEILAILAAKSNRKETTC